MSGGAPACAGGDAAPGDEANSRSNTTSTAYIYGDATVYFTLPVADSLPWSAVMRSSQLPGRRAAPTIMGIVPEGSGGGRSAVCLASTCPPERNSTWILGLSAFALSG